MSGTGMIIAGMHKLTTVDYPGLVGAIVFTQGCNFHCPYCHNSVLIPHKARGPLLDTATVTAFLEKRAGLLDGLVISGGEPTLQAGLADFCRTAKGMGYKIKLDTNGGNPEVLEALLAARLADYVAMDCKTAPDAYYPHFSHDADIAAKVAASAGLLRASGVPHEFRTTCVHPHVSEAVLPAMAHIVGTEAPWFLQKATMPATPAAVAPLGKTDMARLLEAARSRRMNAALR